MKTFRREIFFAVLLYIAFCLFHFFMHKSFNWIENTGLTLLIVIFRTFFDWALNDKGKKNKSKNLR